MEGYFRNMSQTILVSDFTIKEIPFGGSEWVDQVILSEFDTTFEYSSEISKFDPNNFYIISNISKLPIHLLEELKKCNYIIIEHDSKFCANRHPWAFQNSIVPHQYRVNYDLYKKAKAVFVQTQDHLDVFKINNVEANFYNLDGGIWSKDDLNLLNSLYKQEKNEKFMIYSTDNWIKNTQGAFDFCTKNQIPFELVPDMNDRFNFLNKMSSFSGLVFLPHARETLCRLVVEAKCLGLTVITTKTYGASRSDWFSLDRVQLLDYLKKNTQKNLNVIKGYLA
jgi:hypothetical protein